MSPLLLTYGHVTNQWLKQQPLCDLTWLDRAVPDGRPTGLVPWQGHLGGAPRPRLAPPCGPLQQGPRPRPGQLGCEGAERAGPAQA